MLRNLRSVDLSDNPLNIAPDLSHFPQMTDVRLGNCALSKVPDGLFELPRLTSADLSGNAITELPSEFPSQPGDAVTEFAGQGTADTVIYTIGGLVLPNNVEIGRLSGAAVSLFDSESYALKDRITLEGHPNSLALDDRNGILYVTAKQGETGRPDAPDLVARIAL